MGQEQEGPVLLVGGREPGPVEVRFVGGRVLEAAPRLERQAGERVLDLGGRFLRHGLVDAHAHVVEWARAARDLDLSGLPSAVAAADLVRVAHRSAAEGSVLRGAAFRETSWPDAPVAALLDVAAPGRVVVLRSLDMHTAWLSSSALALCGLPGHPTGLLREHEAWDALSRLPAPGEREDDEAVAEAVRAAHARGVTVVRDFSFEDAHGSWRRRQQQQGGRLPLRITAVVQPAQLSSFVERQLGSGDGDDFLRVGPLKLFVDGALGARTARCLTPYEGGTDRGRLLLDPEALDAALAEAGRAGFEVAVHAIGDEATRDALRALQASSVRGSIEHAQLLRHEDLGLFRAAGVIASIQPAHLLDDASLVDDLWRHSSSVAYAVRSLVDAGADVRFGSDAPVSPLDPWLSIAAAVHRTDGTVEAWRTAEAVPVEVALAASGGRRVRPGDRADLVVLDVPELEGLSARDLATVPVHATFVDGRCVHGPWVEDTSFT